MAAVLDFPRQMSTEPLGALHSRLSAPLRRYFRSFRLNAADVEDLTQDVFVRLAGPTHRAELLKPEAFVFTLARNLVRDRARRFHTRMAAHAIAVEDADLSCDRPTPEQWLDLTQQLQHVERVLASLKPHARKAFMLHRVHGDSHSAIAVQMGISVSMVEKHIMSAMSALRRYAQL
jgi:RNA polymerase sigma factor (sigma-70 family)